MQEWNVRRRRQLKKPVSLKGTALKARAKC